MLRFGTAGLRGPLQDGPDGMNIDTVTRASAGVAAWLRDRCLGGGLVIVGRDGRHGSDEFATATAEVFAAAGFSVLSLPRPLPTPVVAFAVRELKAVAGVQITASHNPATDNGYKLYLDGGSQLVPPADTEIERCIDAVTVPVPRTDPAATAPDPVVFGLPAGTTATDLGEEIVRRYLTRVITLPDRLGIPGASAEARPSANTDAQPSASTGIRPGTRLDANTDTPPSTNTGIRPSASTGSRPGASTGTRFHASAEARSRMRADIRIALTAMHGVGGDLAVAALAEAGFTDVHVVAEQFEPDPDFPTVAFPNPEEPGAADRLLALAARIGADLAIALDPDADRCAVGVPGPDGPRMLRGDETGVLLGDFVLRGAPADALVATTIVSSRLLGKLAPARGARYAETLTGFKWLARAGEGLVYAYEEAIGHCVDPAAVRDKDGISAAVAMAELVARLKATGRDVLGVLDEYAVEFGVHAGDQVSLRLAGAAEAAAVVSRLRENPPAEIAGHPVTHTDLSRVRGRMRTDALIFQSPAFRMVVRPSGTEPKLKCYLEAFVPVPDADRLAEAKEAAAQQLSDLREFCGKL